MALEERMYTKGSVQGSQAPPSLQPSFSLQALQALLDLDRFLELLHSPGLWFLSAEGLQFPEAVYWSNRPVVPRRKEGRPSFFGVPLLEAVSGREGRSCLNPESARGRDLGAPWALSVYSGHRFCTWSTGCVFVGLEMSQPWTIPALVDAGLLDSSWCPQLAASHTLSHTPS